MHHIFHSKQVFELESGHSLPEITISYHTYGQINAAADNVVWVCHALTANSDVADWWKGVVGKGCVIDPEKYFIVCANMLGSCYGSSGPLSENPLTKTPYYSSFPAITIRDMVKAHELLRQYLGISQIYLLMGGSMGGYQILEWCLLKPALIQHLFLIGTSAQESAWGIAVHEAQRLAIEADQSWKDNDAAAGSKGLKAARAIGMLTYRNYGIMVKSQTDSDPEKLSGYKAAGYINYQGDKLVQRFNAYSYWLLTRSMDSHHIARNRGGNVAALLQTIPQKTLIIGIGSDILCPPREQQFIAANMSGSTYLEIESDYGHDGFLVETEAISNALNDWLTVQT